MSDEQIRRTLSRLHEELESADQVNPALRSLLKEVDDDIHKFLGTQSGPSEGLMERVEDLAAAFAASHPQVERFLRELVDSLGKLGI